MVCFPLKLSIMPQISCKVIKLLSWKELISWLVRVVFMELVWYLFSSSVNNSLWQDEAGSSKCSLCLPTTVTTAAYRQLKFEGSFSANSTNTWWISSAAGTVRGVLPSRNEVLISIIYRGKNEQSSLWAFWQLSVPELCWCDLIFRFLILIQFFSEFFH